MTLKLVDRVGSVSITLNRRDNRYHLRYWNPTLGRVKTIATGIKAETARQLKREGIPVNVRKQAADLNTALGSGVAKHLVSGNNPTIDDAMTLAVQNCRAQTEGRRRDLVKFGGYFQDFMGEQFPGIRYWADVRISHVLAFIKTNKKRGVSPKSLKHYCGPLTLTANFWHRENPDTFRPLLIQSPDLAIRQKPIKHYLSPEQLLYLADLARERGIANEKAAVYFGGFAGLNLLEIIRLTPAHFDLKAGTVEITESKNAFRERTIPLIDSVGQFVRPLIKDGGNSLLWTKSDGTAATHDIISRAVRRLLDKAFKLTGEVAFKNADPKDLRKTFVNLCVSADVPEWATGAYVGHRPTSMTAQAYADYGRTEYLRKEVVGRLEAHLAEVNTGANVVAIHA